MAVAGADPEGVHQVRVAAGRLAVWLELAGRRTLADDLRRLRQAAAPVRDADVLLDRELPPEVAAWLRARREADRPVLAARILAPGTAALRRAFGVLPPIPRNEAIERLGRFTDRVRRRGAAAAAAPDDDEVIHALRRALRKLRYALDWVGAPDPRLKELQQTLGDLNDTAVELRTVEASGLAGNHPAYVHALRTRRAAQRSAALAAWHRHAADAAGGPA